MVSKKQKEIADAITHTIVTAKEDNRNLKLAKTDFEDARNSFIAGTMSIFGVLPPPWGSLIQLASGIYGVTDNAQNTKKNLIEGKHSVDNLIQLYNNKDKKLDRTSQVLELTRRFSSAGSSATELFGVGIAVAAVAAPPVATIILLTSAALKTVSLAIKTGKILKNSDVDKKTKALAVLGASAKFLHTSASIGLVIAASTGMLAVLGGPVGMVIAGVATASWLAVSHFNNKRLQKKQEQRMEALRNLKDLTHDDIRDRLSKLGPGISPELKSRSSATAASMEAQTIASPTSSTVLTRTVTQKEGAELTERTEAEHSSKLEARADDVVHEEDIDAQIQAASHEGQKKKDGRSMLP